MSTSYVPASVGADGLTGEIERLERQAELTFPAEAELLHTLIRAEATEGRSVLDVGCGTGAFTRRLRAAWPASRIEGIDVDPELLEHVGPPSRIVDRNGRLGPPSAYDLVVVRFVAQHLGEGERRRLWPRVRDVLRPSGVLAVIDVDDRDWGRVSPAVPDVESVYRKVARLQEQRGGDRDVLPKVMAELSDPAYGFETPKRCRGQVTSDQVPLERFETHLGPQRHVGHLADAGIDLKDLALVTAAWNAVRRNPTSRASVHVHLVYARRAERPVR